jgi:hypothetical protein
MSRVIRKNPSDPIARTMRACGASGCMITIVVLGGDLGSGDDASRPAETSSSRQFLLGRLLLGRAHSQCAGEVVELVDEFAA